MDCPLDGRPNFENEGGSDSDRRQALPHGVYILTEGGLQPAKKPSVRMAGHLQAVVAPAFNPTTQEAEAGGSL